jgi:type I restriction enzyme S subunit
MKWPTQQLDEVADFRLGKMLDEKKNRGDLLPYLANVNVRWGEFDFSELREMRFEDHEVDTFGLRHGDIVMCEGGEPGRCAIWKEQRPGMMIQKAIHRIRPHACLDHEFLYYTFLYMGKTGRFAPLFTGATIKHLPREKLALLEVPIPPLPVQKSIASLLSAYDDLIENNRRRMALLEESARLLYQEWFVRLRFPGHEHVGVTNRVPEGWARITLGDLCQIRRGASPRPIQAFMGGTVPWFKIGDATSSSSMYVFRTAEHVTEEGAKRSVLLGPGELIISNSATCGLPYFTGVTGCIHDGWLLLQPSSFASRELLYLCLQTKREELVSSVSDGSTQKNLNTEAAGRLPLVFPTSDSLTREFDTTVQPIFTQIHVLARCNDSAQAARDLLLPRLMSGEVSL